MKDAIAEKIAGRIKTLPDHMKRDFMKSFYEKNKDNPEIDSLCEQLREKIGYDRFDYR